MKPEHRFAHSAYKIQTLQMIAALDCFLKTKERILEGDSKGF
jgi:hypothetical protein